MTIGLVALWIRHLVGGYFHTVCQQVLGICFLVSFLLYSTWHVGVGTLAGEWYRLLGS